MKRGRGKKGHGLSDKEYVHFRLCHICLHLNEASTEIVRCGKCSKYLSLESGWESAELRKKSAREADEEEASLPEPKKRALTGLSVVW